MSWLILFCTTITVSYIIFVIGWCIACRVKKYDERPKWKITRKENNIFVWKKRKIGYSMEISYIIGGWCSEKEAYQYAKDYVKVEDEGERIMANLKTEETRRKRDQKQLKKHKIIWSSDRGELG